MRKPLARNLSCKRNRFLLLFVLPAFAALLIVAAVLAAFVAYSATEADRLAAEQQQQLVETVIRHRIADTAHDQEGVTIWDQAARHANAAKPDLEWLDGNVGTWMHTYYGHDEAYVVRDTGEPIYAMRGGVMRGAEEYHGPVENVARPLIQKLRFAMVQPGRGTVEPRTQSAGAIDLAVVGSRAAIVSVKPIIDDTGEVRQPGREPIHIAVRYLDGDFLEELATSYALSHARFSRVALHDWEVSVPVTSTNKTIIGYISWEPFRPGTLLTKRLLPLSLVALVLVSGLLALVLLHLRRSTVALEASEAQAQHLAFHDTLTGLANRSIFDTRLAQSLAAARAQGNSIALLYLDLDGFKNINDTLGHPAGDALIRAVAQRLRNEVRETDLVARLGGDEFAIIQTGITSPGEAEILCLRLLEAIYEPFDLAGAEARVGVSVGVAFGPGDADDRSELTRKADIALYEAKAAGKGRFLFFADGMDVEIRHRRLVETELAAALEAGDQLEVYYQPVYSPENGKATGAEALLRWHHPAQGMISPALFVPIAEHSGLIVELGEWVLERACRDARLWPSGDLSVNVSAVQLRRRDFADKVMRILERVGFPPNRLELEITETSFLENATACEGNIVRLRNQGIKIALDDFGTGYSSFSHLSSLSVDRVKIDRSFVSVIGASGEGSAVVKAILDLAAANGLKVTAEGVETDEQRRFLSRIGCHSLQGYLMAKPMPARQMMGVLDRQSEWLGSNRKAG